MCIVHTHKHQRVPLRAHRNLTWLEKSLLHLSVEDGNPSFYEPVSAPDHQPECCLLQAAVVKGNVSLCFPPAMHKPQGLCVRTGMKAWLSALGGGTKTPPSPGQPPFPHPRRKFPLKSNSTDDTVRSECILCLFLKRILE